MHVALVLTGAVAVVMAVAWGVARVVTSIVRDLLTILVLLAALAVLTVRRLRGDL